MSEGIRLDGQDNVMSMHRQMAQMMRAVAPPPQEENLVGWWKFNEGAGGNILDYSGNNLTANTASPVWDNTDEMSLHVTAPTDLEVNSDLLDITGPITILARIKYAGGTGVPGIFTRTIVNGVAYSNFDFRMNDGMLELVRATGTGYCVSGIGSPLVPTNQWITVGVSSDSGLAGNAAYFVINDTYSIGAVGGNCPGETASFSDYPTLFGNRIDNGYNPNNYYADLKIYDRALSEAEMLAYTGLD